MSLEPLLKYLEDNAAEVDLFETISPSFTPTGVAFVTDTHPEIETAFDLPPLLLADIIEDYRRIDAADRADTGLEPYTGDDTFLLFSYGTDTLVNHVLTYMRKRKLALLAG